MLLISTSLSGVCPNCCVGSEARTDTTQQSGQTPDKEVAIKNITVYVSGYTERPDIRGR
jgi:hypothetical protein